MYKRQGIARGVGGFAFGSGGGGGVEDIEIPVEATGGTKIPAAVAPNGFAYHIFASIGSDTLQVTNAGDSRQRMEILVIGGGGGATRGGAGGAGGIIYADAAPVVAATMPVSVGGGGAGKQHPGNATAGSNSVFTHPLGCLLYTSPSPRD